jgi:hypothetical protein
LKAKLDAQISRVEDRIAAGGGVDRYPAGAD